MPVIGRKQKRGFTQINHLQETPQTGIDVLTRLPVLRAARAVGVIGELRFTEINQQQIWIVLS